MFSIFLSRVRFSQALSLSALALFCFACAVPMQASVIGVGPGVFPPDLFGPCAGCTQLAYLNSGPIAATNGAFTFTLTTAVYNDPNAVAGIRTGAGLDFVYQVFNAVGARDPIGRVTATDFTGFLTDVGYSTAGEPAGGGTAFPTGTATPGQVTRFTNSTVGWDFTAGAPGSFTPIAAGATSVVMVIQTNATAFTTGSLSAIDGGVGTTPAFQPRVASVVPEPASFALIGGGLLALAGIRRFRRQ